MSGYGGHRSGAGRKSTIPFNANTNHKLNTFFVTSSKKTNNADGDMAILETESKKVQVEQAHHQIVSDIESNSSDSILSQSSLGEKGINLLNMSFSHFSNIFF